MTIVAPDGFMSVPPGKVATVVTSLEMMSRPASIPARGNALDQAIVLRRVNLPGLDWYRQLFNKVGADWLWFSRLRISDEDLTAIIHDPAVAVHVLIVDGEEAGILELDFRQPRACEIAFFGLTAPFIARGLGGYLMRAAIDLAWVAPIDRLWVHTCTLDHPAALQFYRRMGFKAYRQQIEIADDPRVGGLLPRSCGTHIPVFDE